MNRFYRKLLLTCTAGMGLFAMADMPSAQAAREVKVQVNDTLVAFPEALPFIDAANTLQIPLRSVTEGLGYRTEWSMAGGVVTVTLTKEGRSIVLKTGDSTAVVFGKEVKLDSAPQLISSSVYLPLRFVSETFGYRIQWDALNRIAIINEDGQYHAPAWYAQKAQPAVPTVLQSAYKYQGAPYVWGGGSPEGFDCSGFVSYVFRQHGVQLPRTSLEMYESAGTAVTDLQEGDLVFFAEEGRTSHVGIYTGKGQFISAANSYGVSVSSLMSGYWSKKYVGAKRVSIS